MGDQKISELLHQYFELGVAEGREGRNHDTEAGDAQRVLSEIEAEIAALAPQNLVGRLGRRIHNQRVRLRYWEELFNEHVHAHLHTLHPRHLMKAIELGNENFRLRQLLSEAEKREREARAKAVEDVLSALTAHELYQYRPKAFQGFIDYARSALQSEER